MNRLLKFLTVLIIFFVTSNLTFSQPSDKRIIGYFTSWSVYVRDYHVPDIPAEQITHINYAFANIDNAAGTIMLGDAYADIDKWYPGDSWDPDSLRGSFHQLQILKGNHPHVKTFISVGGWTWSTYFSNIALTPQSRNTFASSCMEFITEYTFDGVDIDWEYPVSGGLGTNIYRPEDRENYTLLMQELRRQLDSLEVANGQEYLLTMAAPANPEIIANIEVDPIHQYLDWINIMTYDLHGPWGGSSDPCTGFNTPLHIDPEAPYIEPYFSHFNMEAALDNYLAESAPLEKLQPGLAFYGRGFGSVENVNNGLYAGYNGPCWQGTWEGGVFDYYDLEQNYINLAGYTRYWYETCKVPWLFNPTAGVMISYDDVESMTEKCNFINQRNLPGVMFWEFSGDRFGILLESIYEELQPAPPEVSLTPSAPPIQIPANGGTFDFNIEVVNNGNSQEIVDVWTMVTLPNGTEYGPIINFPGLTMNPGWSGDRDRIQNVPANAPAGNYFYDAYIGIYPDEILSEDHFDFEKIAAAESGATVNDWGNWGEAFDVSTESSGVIPVENILISAYPNPFNPSTEIEFSLKHGSDISLKVFDITGRETAILAEGYYPSGDFSFSFDGSDLSSGVYFAVLEAKQIRHMSKLLLIK